MFAVGAVPVGAVPIWITRIDPLLKVDCTLKVFVTRLFAVDVVVNV